MNDTNVLRFELDLTNIEEADDGNTTYYGGTYLFNDEERHGRGNDRSDSYLDDIDIEIAETCQRAWPDLEDYLDENDFLDQLRDVKDELWKSSGLVTVSRDGDNLTVTVEKKES